MIYSSTAKLDMVMNLLQTGIIDMQEAMYLLDENYELTLKLSGSVLYELYKEELDAN